LRLVISSHKRFAINSEEIKMGGHVRMPKISVIIPVYNAEKYLKQCLDSVLIQRYKDIEIICVDDGSTDSSAKIIEAYSEKDDRFILIKQDHINAGAARNKGIQMAKGDFLHFLDADDWLMPNAYAQALNAIEKAGSDVCVFNYKRFNDITKASRPVQLFSELTIPGSMMTVSFSDYLKQLIYSSVVPWNKIYRRNFIVENGIIFDGITCANDRTFYFRMITSASKITLLNKELIVYREGNADSLVEQRMYCFDSLYEAFKNTVFFTKSLNTELRKMIADVAVKDILTFYLKIPGANKYEITRKTTEFFSSLPEIDILRDNLSAYSWYPEYQVFTNFKTREFTEKNTIPIVLATDDNYATYLAVTIKSITATASNRYNYHIYIFYTDLSDKYKELILQQEIPDYVDICFINISSKIESAVLYAKSHCTKEMYYRLFISEILSMYDKVIYLDCDLAVTADISALFESDLNGAILGGVINIADAQMQEYIANELKLSPDSYINSGVLLINCFEFNDKNIKNKCLGKLRQLKKLDCPDQDVLNLCCAGKIKLLDAGWNLQWHELVFDNPQSTHLYRYKEAIDQMERDHKIIHYTSSKKAWNFPGRKYSKYFWDYAKKTSLYEDIISQELNKTNQKFSSQRPLYEPYENAIEISYLNQELQNIQKSWSFRIGRFITFIPRKITGGIRCYREHGMRYTLRLLARKATGKQKSK